MSLATPPPRAAAGVADDKDSALAALRALLIAQRDSRQQDIRICEMLVGSGARIDFTRPETFHAQLEALTPTLLTDARSMFGDPVKRETLFMLLEILGIPANAGTVQTILPKTAAKAEILMLTLQIFLPSLKQLIFDIDIETLERMLHRIDKLYEFGDATLEDKQNLIDLLCDELHVRSLKATALHIAFEEALRMATQGPLVYESARQEAAENAVVERLKARSAFGDTYDQFAKVLFRVLYALRSAGLDLTSAEISEQISQEDFMRQVYEMLKLSVSATQKKLETLYTITRERGAHWPGSGRSSNLAITNINDLQILYQMFRDKEVAAAKRLFEMKRRRNAEKDRDVLVCFEEFERQYDQLGKDITTEMNRLLAGLSEVPPRIIYNFEEHRALKMQLARLLVQLEKLNNNEVVPELLQAAERSKAAATTAKSGKKAAAAKPAPVAAPAAASKPKPAEAPPSAATPKPLRERAKSTPAPAAASGSSSAAAQVMVDPARAAREAAEQEARLERARIEAARAQEVTAENARIAAAKKKGKEKRGALGREAEAAVEARMLELEAILEQRLPPSRVIQQRLDALAANPTALELVRQLYASPNNSYDLADLKTIAACLDGEVVTCKRNLILFRFNTTQEGDERPSQLVIGPLPTHRPLTVSQVRTFVEALQREHEPRTPGLGITATIFQRFYTAQQTPSTQKPGAAPS